MKTQSGSWWQACICAFQFLTRIPIPVQVPFTAEVMRRSVLFYPLVGILIGLVVVTSLWGLQFVLPPLPAAVLTTAIWIALSGALHVDGLMDSADGLLSHRSRERRLEIMRDSRVGAMGVVVCVLYLLLKVSLIASGIEASHLLFTAMLVQAPIWSRWFMTAAIVLWPYARETEGMGSLLRTVRKQTVLAGLVLAGGLAGLSGYITLEESLLLSVVAAVSGLGLSLLVGSVLAWIMFRKLGGLTGDTYGALNECIEVVILLVAVAICYWNPS